MLILWCGPFRCLYGGVDRSGVSTGVDTVVQMVHALKLWCVTVQVSVQVLILWSGPFRCQY